MMSTIWPGSMAFPAGGVTCASTLPTATAMPSGQPGPGRGAGGERAGPRAQRGDRVLQLVLGEAGEPWVQRGEVLPGGVVAVLADALVPGGAGVARLGAAQLPDDPVGRLDPALGPLVDLRVLVQHLERLRVLPLGGDLPAVPGQPRLAALAGQGVDPVRLPLGGVVLPQLHVGVRAGVQAGELAERGAVASHRERRGRGEIGADADDASRDRSPLGPALLEPPPAARRCSLPGSCRAQSGGSGSPVAASSASITPCR